MEECEERKKGRKRRESHREGKRGREGIYITKEKEGRKKRMVN